MRLPIPTTNHKNITEAITKGELAFEVAKLVKHQGGCGVLLLPTPFRRTICQAQRNFLGATFENAVSTELSHTHVLRVCWQSELWHEVTTPSPNLLRNLDVSSPLFGWAFSFFHPLTHTALCVPFYVTL